VKYNLEKLFDPIQVKYIKSYEESAVGKYFYWDLLGTKGDLFKFALENIDIFRFVFVWLVGCLFDNAIFCTTS